MSWKRVLLVAAFLMIIPVGTKEVQAIDNYCRRTSISFNDGFNHYVVQENVGLVGVRLYGNLQIYDLCDHGGITGTIGVYGANISAKGGSFNTFFEYQRNTEPNRWRSDFLSFTQPYTSAVSRGWTFWNIQAYNIGMSRSTHFAFIRLRTNLIFYGVPAASKMERCDRSGARYVCRGM